MGNGKEDCNGEGAQEKEKDDDGFTTVPVKNGNAQSTSRGRKNRKGKNAAPAPKNLVTLVEERKQELRRDGYSQRCLSLLQGARPNLLASTSCRRCICFGLGSLRDSPKSQLQLALLQDLLGAFQLDEPLLVVDPAFAQEDEAFFEEQGYRISPYSDDLLRLQCPTLLYMPHCPRSLYERLLEENQGRLGNLLLLGNPLDQYAERELRAAELEKIPRLRDIGKNLECLIVAEYEGRPDAFNDMAWQWLPAGPRLQDANGEVTASRGDQDAR